MFMPGALQNIGWHWRKLYAPPQVMRMKNHLTTIQSVSVVDPGPAGDVTKYPRHDTVLITGDGQSMIGDVTEFEGWGVPHDLYCVNRSLIYFERPVDHWAAIDIEESGWFAENVNFKVDPDGKLMRHTIGDGSFAYDVYWAMDIPPQVENTFVRRVLVGNTGYFAILTALKMGYRKVVVAGMPLNMERCWYEPEDADGPNWMGWMYVQWMDFKLNHPQADRVRSLSGYSKFILGEATKAWTLDCSTP
jgi:hypothetical protein